MGTALRTGVAGLLGALLITAACGSEVTSTPTGAGGQGVGPGTGGGGPGTGGAGQTASQCFEDHFWVVQPDYDQFSPTIGSHCLGTNHQDIVGVEKLVFLGDSITQGTPPTPSSQYYRTLLADQLGQLFPGLEVEECAENGAQVDDLLANQIPDCFPGPEDKTTLVVMTMGGNDVIEWPQGSLSFDEASMSADQIAADMRAAVEWFRADPARFPNGVFVVFANVYEYTDGTAELGSCPGAQFLGLGGVDYSEGAAALTRLDELYMQIAVDTQTDMIFLLEEFCGHGWRRDSPSVGCNLGADPELWFDITCIHPTPEGHAALANMFRTVIEE